MTDTTTSQNIDLSSWDILYTTIIGNFSFSAALREKHKTEREKYCLLECHTMQTFMDVSEEYIASNLRVCRISQASRRHKQLGVQVTV
jgi:hypothetical protein